MSELLRRTLWQDGSFPKHCSCGAIYQADSWSSLAYCGVLSGKVNDIDPRVFSDLEIRRCTCGSSLAVRLKDREDSTIADAG